MTLHNIPEGILVFASSLYNPKKGVAMAVAVACMNVPDGLAVAIPVYYTGQGFWTAFWLCFVSSIAEPIGALIAWAILDSWPSAEVIAIMFGIVGGIMMHVCVAELLPIISKTRVKDTAYIFMFVGFLIIE